MDTTYVITSPSDHGAFVGLVGIFELLWTILVAVGYARLARARQGMARWLAWSAVACLVIGVLKIDTTSTNVIIWGALLCAAHWYMAAFIPLTPAWVKRLGSKCDAGSSPKPHAWVCPAPKLLGRPCANCEGPGTAVQVMRPPVGPSTMSPSRRPNAELLADQWASAVCKQFERHYGLAPATARTVATDRAGITIWVTVVYPAGQLDAQRHAELHAELTRVLTHAGLWVKVTITEG